MPRKIDLRAGEKKQVILEPLAGYEMPATLIRGASPGKTVLITAGIHAGEYPGIPAVIRIARELDPAAVSGNLILIHCVNTSGFWARTDALVPEDGGNLNACYPGVPDGTVSQRIADYFVKRLFPHADFILDLHSGGQQEPLAPCLFFPAGEKVRAAALDAALALDVPYLIESHATTGEYSYAANVLGIPALLLECGHTGYCLPEWIESDRRNIRLLLSHLGCLPDPERSAREHHVFVRTVYLESGEKGLWYPAVAQDEPVGKGQLLGRTEDFFGNTLHEYFAEAGGIVFYHTCGLSVLPGTPLVAYGVEKEARR